MHPSIGVVIPTYQAAKHLPHCLPFLLNSPLKPRVLIIDSSSTDDTVKIAQSMGAEAMVISQTEFNHGLTREKGRKFLDTSVIVMMTQDAYPLSYEMLEQLVFPLVEGKTSIAYARQLPHQGTRFFGAFSREFNYPPASHVRSIDDIPTYGIYTFFCSNSCAAYLNCALDEIGGFPDVLFGEDTVVTARLLQNNHRIAYVAEAEVYHSHDYGLKEEFFRHFDMGFSREVYHELLKIGGGDSRRGKKYVQALVKKLWREIPSLIPYALLQTLVKWAGYRLGRSSTNAPIGWKRFFSRQKFYWDRLEGV